MLPVATDLRAMGRCLVRVRQCILRHENGCAAGAPENTPREATQLLVMIAALRIIKDPSADNDRGTHAEERNKASQYPDHCSLPWFFYFSTHDNTHYICLKQHRR